MQIILISDRLGRARSVTLSLRHLVAAGVMAAAALCAGTVSLYWATLRFSSDFDNPVVQRLVVAAQQAEAKRAREFVQQNLNAMAVKLGRMQAQLTRLDALGERVSSMAGLKPQEFRLWEAPGLGGATATLLPPQTLTVPEFNSKVATVERQVQTRADMLGLLDSRLRQLIVRRMVMPTAFPVHAPQGSGFGRRIDPFNGTWAMHEGIDFEVDTGTPVHAAAAGVVRYAGHHPQYGNMIDLDHPDDLMTRYAHLSKLLVKTGDIVRRGQVIGLSGSTGRATGPHLHFEVRYQGVAVNPKQFLAASNPTLPRLGRHPNVLAKD